MTRLFNLVEDRRPAGYLVASESSKAFEDPGLFVEVPMVNRIRPRVKAWREAGYPGVSSITKRLLEHWTHPEKYEVRRLFFCQLEAVETLIWLAEAAAACIGVADCIHCSASLARLASAEQADAAVARNRPPVGRGGSKGDAERLV